MRNKFYFEVGSKVNGEPQIFLSHRTVQKIPFLGRYLNFLVMGLFFHSFALMDASAGPLSLRWIQRTRVGVVPSVQKFSPIERLPINWEARPQSRIHLAKRPLSVFSSRFLAPWFSYGKPLSAQEDFLGSKNQGMFLIPNEFSNFVYSPFLEKSKGVLVSVGTLRTLFNARMGNFSRVLMLDYDSVASDYNRATLQVIADLSRTGESPEIQRYWYLSLLYGRSIPLSILHEIEGLKDLDDEERLGRVIAELQLSTSSEFDLQLSNFPPELRGSARILIDLFHLSKSGKSSVWKRYNELNGLDFSDTELTATQKIAIKHARAKMVFWGSDEAWLKIQKMILEDRIWVVQGSLGGDLALRSFAESLETSFSQEKVAVLDVSNALDYLIAEGLWNQFMRNVERLPKDPQFKFFYSVLLPTTSGLRVPGDHWGYGVGDLLQMKKFSEFLDGSFCTLSEIHEHEFSDHGRKIFGTPQQGLIVCLSCP